MAKTKIKGGKKIEKALKELEKIGNAPNKVLVGLPNDALPYPDGTSVIMVGTVNEFGSADGRIPERSFLRSGLERNQQMFLNFWKRKFAKAILTGEIKPAKALALLGQLAQDAIQQQIVAIKTPANKQATISEKGSSNPLIDTGHMRQSIRWQIKK